MIRVLLVAAYASVRAGLYALLAGAGDCVVVGQVSGSADLERVLPDLRPDVVLLDAPPGGDLAAILQVMGDSSGLVLLGEGAEEGLPLLSHGLAEWSWLRKDAEAGEIVGAVRAVAAGLVVLEPSFLPRLTRRGVTTRDDTAPTETLTAREREVLQLMARGLPNKQIAARLSISLHTAKFHVASILAKLGAASRTEAVTRGARHGWVLL